MSRDTRVYHVYNCSGQSCLYIIRGHALLMTIHISRVRYMRDPITSAKFYKPQKSAIGASITTDGLLFCAAAELEFYLAIVVEYNALCIFAAHTKRRVRARNGMSLMCEEMDFCERSLQPMNNWCPTVWSVSISFAISQTNREKLVFFSKRKSFLPRLMNFKFGHISFFLVPNWLFLKSFFKKLLTKFKKVKTQTLQ